MTAWIFCCINKSSFNRTNQLKPTEHVLQFKTFCPTNKFNFRQKFSDATRPAFPKDFNMISFGVKSPPLNKTWTCCPTCILKLQLCLIKDRSYWGTFLGVSDFAQNASSPHRHRSSSSASQTPATPPGTSIHSPQPPTDTYPPSREQKLITHPGVN